MENHDVEAVETVLADLSDGLNLRAPAIGIVLAAGHGKRIKSETSKMLHEIWGVPTVQRVSKAVCQGLRTDNLIIVTGVKAVDVAKAVGRRRHTVFAYQAEQRGTGHAVQAAMRHLGRKRFTGSVLVSPGDVGLLNATAVRSLCKTFQKQRADMGVLTGRYDGDPESNYFGRIVRAPDDSPERGKILGIVEFKDIVKMKPRATWTFRYNGREYAYGRRELLETREFNTGVFIYRAAPLLKYLYQIGTDNVQGEVYLTDLITIFVNSGLSVVAHVAKDNAVSLGFNNKTVLKQMERIARQRVYERLSDIITIRDEDNFFIADEVVEDLIRKDRKGRPLDIVVDVGARIHKGAKLNYGVVIGRDATIDGNVHFGRNVEVGNSAMLTCYSHQKIAIGDNCAIMHGDMVKGNVTIGDNVRIESNVIVTGSDEYPVVIDHNVTVKGTTYIFGCQIEPDVSILHSVLIRKLIHRIERPDGVIQPIRFYLPLAEGIDSIVPLDTQSGLEDDADTSAVRPRPKPGRERSGSGSARGSRRS
ncbi:MAG: NTP transferase domain-containing protein [Phycisphaerae bacterium]|nr:NTP transferase domain-containing protein [Phycisphaerae bacterium]